MTKKEFLNNLVIINNSTFLLAKPVELPARVYDYVEHTFQSGWTYIN